MAAGDNEVVAGQTDVFGEHGVDFGVEAHLVADVGEEGLAGLAVGDYGEGLGQGEMGEVLTLTEGVDNEDVEIGEFGELATVDMVHVGDVGQGGAVAVVDAEAEDGEVLVEPLEGGDDGVADGERGAGGDVVEGGFGKAGVLMVLEDVAIVVADGRDGVGVGVDVHVLMLNPVEGADVVDAADVVAMGVCQQNCVEMRDVVAEHLCAEIGAYIDEDVGTGAVGDESGGAEPFVAGVVGAADGTGTGYNGHSLRSTRSEECDGHQKWRGG